MTAIGRRARHLRHVSFIISPLFFTCDNETSGCRSRHGPVYAFRSVPVAVPYAPYGTVRYAAPHPRRVREQEQDRAVLDHAHESRSQARCPRRDRRRLVAGPPPPTRPPDRSKQRKNTKTDETETRSTTLLPSPSQPISLSCVRLVVCGVWSVGVSAKQAL